MKNKLSIILTTLIAVLITGGIVLAANTFPTTLNTWSSGDVIEEDWANALEIKIGVDGSAVVTSIDYLIKNAASKLGSIANITPTDGVFIVADGSKFVGESGSTARSSIGLGAVENTALSTWVGTSNITTVGTLTTAGGNISLWTNDSGYITATLTQEEVDDYVNALLKDADSVNTRITLTYDDVNNAFDFVVDDMNDDVPDAGDFGAATDLDANGAVAWGNIAEGELANSSVISADIKDGVLLEADLKIVDSPTDEDIFTYEATTGDFEWHSAAEMGIGTATSITDNLIINADLNIDAEATDGDFLQYDSTGDNFTWRSGSETLSDIGAAATNQTMYIGTTGVAIDRASAALTLAGITLTTPDIGTPSAGTLTNCGGTATSLTSGNVSCAECLILGTEVKAGTLTDTKVCTWDNTNSQIVCNSDAGAGDMTLAGVQTVTGAKTFGTIGGAVGKLILAGSTSGSSILNAAAVAGATTITLPDATGTLALNNQTMYIGTTAVAINRSSAALTLAGITLTTPDLGTPTTLVGTNISGTGANFTAGHVTTNANLTGEVTSVGNAATIADSIAVTSWNLTTPTITTSIDLPAGAINTATEIAADLITYTQILDADQNDTKCILIETPADADDLLFFRNDRAITVTSIDCIVEAATSAIVVINECDSAGDTCGAANSRVEESLTCDVNGAADDGTIGNAGVASGGWLRAQVGTVTGTPGHVTVCVTYNYDD